MCILIISDYSSRAVTLHTYIQNTEMCILIISDYSSGPSHCIPTEHGDVNPHYQRLFLRAVTLHTYRTRRCISSLSATIPQGRHTAYLQNTVMCILIISDYFDPAPTHLSTLHTYTEGKILLSSFPRLVYSQ